MGGVMPTPQNQGKKWLTGIIVPALKFVPGGIFLPHRVWVQDALGQEAALVDLEPNQSKDGQHKDTEDHDIPKPPHSLHQGPHNGLQTWYEESQDNMRSIHTHSNDPGYIMQWKQEQDL